MNGEIFEKVKNKLLQRIFPTLVLAIIVQTIANIPNADKPDSGVGRFMQLNVKQARNLTYSMVTPFPRAENSTGNTHFLPAHRILKNVTVKIISTLDAAAKMRLELSGAKMLGVDCEGINLSR
jgi:hypothetical protein